MSYPQLLAVERGAEPLLPSHAVDLGRVLCVPERVAARRLVGSEATTSGTTLRAAMAVDTGAVLGGAVTCAVITSVLQPVISQRGADTGWDKFRTAVLICTVRGLWRGANRTCPSSAPQV